MFPLDLFCDMIVETSMAALGCLNVAIKRRTIFKRKNNCWWVALMASHVKLSPVTMGVVVEYCATRTHKLKEWLEINERNNSIL